MLLQHFVLPCVYDFWRIVYRNRKPELIVFADAHHDTMPFSMMEIHEQILRRGYQVVDQIYNFAKMGQLGTVLVSIRFMKLYAQAKYVFICDNFLPVSSCKKRAETKVIQLLHSSGLLKRMGYDTDEDIPAYYHGNVYRNYDLVTVSAPCCVEPFSRSLRQDPGVVQPLGTSRTDVFYRENWQRNCADLFYSCYPEARGKKVILWAPTFRGNAGDPYQIGVEEIERLEKELGEDYILIRKVHPHVDTKYHLSNCDIPTEQLLPVTDLMITDYSSVVIDFLFFNKPYVLFAPDLEEYQQKRGFYVEYDSLTPYVVTDEKALKENVLAALNDQNMDWIEKNREYHRSEHLKIC